MGWTVLLPTKTLSRAKSRLLPASADVDAHTRLVAAIRADTRAAALATAAVARVVVVTDAPGEPDAFVQRRPGLNAGLAEAAEYAARTWPADGIVALLADLPALCPAELGAVLAAAEAHPRSFVADAAGTGTTLLAATPGTPLEPQFGPGSAARHAACATRLDAGARIRTDVDTADDLRAAVRLGVGPATSAALGLATDCDPNDQQRETPAPARVSRC